MTTPTLSAAIDAHHKAAESTMRSVYSERRNIATPAAVARIEIRLQNTHRRLQRELGQLNRKEDAVIRVAVEDALYGIERTLEDCRNMTQVDIDEPARTQGEGVLEA